MLTRASAPVRLAIFWIPLLLGLILAGCEGGQVKTTGDSRPTQYQANPYYAVPFNDEITNLPGATLANNPEAVAHFLQQPRVVREQLNLKCPKNTRCKPVTFAADHGSVEIMAMLLDAGADVNGKTASAGDTPLIISVIKGHYELAEFLVSRGATVDMTNRFGVTSLWGASGMRDRTQFVKLFLENGANANVTGHYPDPLKQVIKNNRPQRIKNITALMMAVAGNLPDTVSLLLQHGADKSRKDSEGRSALDYAEVIGNELITELISG